MNSSVKLRISWFWMVLLLSMVMAVWMVPLSIESKISPIREPVTKKVIVSPHLGEVIQDSRYAGEVVRFRIYYHHSELKKADITIIDKLDANLTNSKVLNSGSYDAASGRVVWQFSNVLPNTAGFVEFEATIGPAGPIANQAEIQIGGPGKGAVKTNAVQIRVLSPPKLGWIPFNGTDPAKTPPRSYMKDETTTGLMVNFDIPGMFASEIKRDGVTYQRLSISGQATMLTEGKPDVPIMGQVLEVPFDVNLGLEVVKAQSITLANYSVYPAQIQIDTLSASQPFTVSKETYLTDAYFPDRPAFFAAEDIGVIRGHRLVFLKVHPLQYNPVTKELKAYKNIEVRITYDRPGQIRRVARRIESAPFEKLLKRLVLNYKAPNRFAETGVHGMVLGKSHDSLLSPFPRPAQAQARVEGCDYLILTHGTFYTNPADPNNPLNRLRAWKESKGLKVWIVDVANIPGGVTAANIKTYLQTVYDTWLPIPAYVLLVGDHELLPTDQGSAPHPSHGNATVPSDLPYASLDGTDYFPDLFIGRLSVDTLTQAQDVVDKILAYEQNPPVNANFYRNATKVAEFEDQGDTANDGREERPWIENVENIRTFLQNNGYVVDRIYATNSGFPATPGAPDPQLYENATGLPNDLLNINGFGWNGGPNDIRNAIQAGRFLVTYRNHGDEISWTRPSYNTGNIGALTNVDLPPVVFSITCRTGWFDDPATECFCEEFLRQNNGRGAVAIIGSTRNSYTGWNDYLMFGFFKAIWPAYTPNPLTTGYPAMPLMEGAPLWQMGQIHTFGKTFMANAYGASIRRRLTFEMYHLFGDPEMPIWTEAPATFRVEHPEGIGSTGTQDFVVKVTNNATGAAVENAVVTLMFNGGRVGAQFTDPNGVARFTGSYAAGDLNLTVTAHNFRPHQGIMKVSAAGAVLNRLDPPDGPVNQAIHVGGQNFAGNENVDIYLGSTIVKTQAASGGSFGQPGVADVDIQIPAVYPLVPVNVWTKGQTGPNNRFAADVFQVHSANPIDLYLYSQWADTTWHLYAGDNPVWDNPDIQLYDAGGNPVASNNLVAGNQYTIKVKVHNDTQFDANNVKVNLKWAHFGAGQPSSAWTAIVPTPEVDVPRTSVWEAEAQWVPPSTGHVCIVAELFHLEDINSANNKGQENCHVGPTSSPAQVPFKIWNPTDKAAAMFLEVRQISPNQPLWRTSIVHPDPQVVPPGGSTKGMVVIEPVKGVDCRQPADFALTGFIDGKMVGGVNFLISCAPAGLLGWKCCLLWGVFLAALIAAIVFLAAALAGVKWAWQALAAAGLVLVVAGLFLLSYCIPAAWRCCSYWLVFGFGLTAALALLILAHYGKKLIFWQAFAVTLAATALLGLILIVSCDASHLMVGGLLMALVLIGLMGYRQFRTIEKLEG